MNDKQSGELWDAIERLATAQASEADCRLLFERYRSLVRAFYARMGVPHQDCGDLTQEVFFRVFSRRGSFKDEARLRAWILTIARNLLSNRWRDGRAKKRDGVEESLSQHSEAALPQGPSSFSSAFTGGRDDSALGELLSKERAEALRDAIAHLPPRMRQCMTLRVIQELSLSEIAAVLQVSIETVKAHLHQGRQRLRESLAEATDTTPSPMEGQH
jgi:RNA polymerase sigma-70 factor (ECF subfamily)